MRYRYIQIIIAMLMLHICGAAELWAEEVNKGNILITLKPSGERGYATDGVTAPEGSVTVAVSDRQVTLHVTPNTGYRIKRSLIVVEKMVNPSRASSRRRSPGLGTFDLTTGSESLTDAADDYTFEIPADYDGAYVTATFVSASGNVITSLGEITEMDGTYVLAQDIDATGFTGLENFTGTLDGNFHKIYNLGTPLFSQVSGGTVRNVMLEGVSITSGDANGNAGAICCVASGAARIYNCGILPTTTNHDSDGNVTGFDGSSVGGSGAVGGIVGKLQGTARVINCFSYATITDGSPAAGIVGDIGYAANSSITQDNYTTVPMVMNCMFYGDITGGSSIAPVYSGADGAMIKHEGDKGVNPYCYFRANAPFNNSTNFNNIDKYKRSWPAEEEYLTRFEYYRSILNSNKKLCAWWITGHNASSLTADDLALIAKWVLDPEMAPYPILKKWDKYPSIINPDPEKTWDPEANLGAGGWQDRSMADPYRGKSFPDKLSVKIYPGAHAATGVEPKTINLTITDMDTLNYDYGYYKVQLPYYNEQFGDPSKDPATEWDARYGGNYKDYVVTGWKITSITGGEEGEFSKNWQTGYNFADRNCTKKDLYEYSGRIFAQGGFFYVPEGVTAITIEAYWGKAVYLHNNGHYLDRVNITNQAANGSLKLGSAFAPTGTLPTKLLNTYTVYDRWDNAVKALGSATLSDGKLNMTVYDQAIVLLSNVQWRNENNKVGTDLDSKWHPYTIMSIDEDLDNEPDYCFEFQFRQQFQRPGIQPIRFDFLPVPELGMAVRYNQNQNTIGIFIPQGHFEITETSFMHTTQFEYDFDGTKVEAPVILNGGHFEQIVVRRGNNNKTSYFLMGGHFRMLRFTPGRHCNADSNGKKTRHCAVNAIGGDYPEFYLSGIYNLLVGVDKDNPHCYTNGGKFGIIAGAGYEPIDGDITFKIDHSIIREFYGGGINGAKPVTGNIEVTINNSLVDKYCGGPKVGEMGAGKTVTTNATGTTFGRYYGGGNGGTSYYREQKQDGNTALPTATASGWGGYGYKDFNPLNTISGTTKSYRGPGDEKGNLGYHALFEFECFVESNGLGQSPTVRSYLHWAQFGTTATGNTTNVLTECTVKNDFYGGGNLGNVNGTVTSTLTDCTVEGNAFGGGFSGKIEPFRIHDKSKTIFPEIDKAGIMQHGNGEFEYIKNTDGTDRYYTWCYKNAEGKVFPEGVVIPNTVNTNNPTFEYPVGSNNWYVLTTVSLEGLGAVSGKATINIEGETQVKGSVFGGGNESAVNGGTEVNIATSLETVAYNCDNVYGGGNTADVKGETKVNVTSGKVKTDVFGGGKGASTIVDGNVTVNIGKKKEGEPLSGTGTVGGDVYGGCAFGAVNAKKDGSTVVAGTEGAPQLTKVNIYKGTVTGSVFGGGLGQVAAGAVAAVGEPGDPGYVPAVPAQSAIVAQNFGKTTVNMEDGTVSAVYGGANVNGVLKDQAEVTITGGTVGTDPGDGDIRNVVFGGGYGEPTLVEGNIKVDIGTEGVAGEFRIWGNVYGGSALGNVNANVNVNLFAGIIRGNVFGGGLGRIAYGDFTDVESKVGGNVTVILNGTKLDCIFTDKSHEHIPDVPRTGQIFGCNNQNGTPLGHVKVHVKKTVNSAKPTVDGESNPITRDMRPMNPSATLTAHGYDVAAVYGGGNLADYLPTNADEFAQVIIEGCDMTSIEYVYGGGNAASVPATEVTVNGTYIIDYLFGGGNGKDKISRDGGLTYIDNPGADIGLRALTPSGTAYAPDPTKEAYGTGRAVSKLTAGKIHVVYGGSNTKGNVRGGTSITMPQVDGAAEPEYCLELDIREIYGAGQNADQDGQVDLVLGCVDNMDVVYGGAKDAHIAGGINLTLTSGYFKQVFGGNNVSGTIQGPITLNIEENACDPVIIEKLFLGGNLAPYSIYGYYEDTTDGNKLKPRTATDTEGDKPYVGSTEIPYKNPILNVISCTEIDNVYGGGFGAEAAMYGSPTVNLNMIPGKHAALMDLDDNGSADGNANALGFIGDVFGGGEKAPVYGKTTVNIGTETTVGLVTEPTYLGTAGTDYTYNATTERYETTVVGTHVTGNVYGGGNEADVEENTYVNICAKYDEDTHEYLSVPEGTGKVIIEGDVFGAGKGVASDVTAALVKGKSNVNMGGGWAQRSIYGGGETASVGNFTFDSNNDITGFAEGYNASNSGKSTVHVFGGKVGPATLIMPNFTGHVFGAGKGVLGADALIPKLNFVQSTDVTVSGTAFIKGSVYGGAEDGHVRGDTYVKIEGGQIGCGYNTDTDTDLDRIYTPEEWAYDVTANPAKFLYECNHWPYTAPYKPYDKFADVYDSKGGAVSGTDGHTFYGNVFGGGSGFEPYAAGEWLESAGAVGGNTKVEITGGHILTSVYGGNELTDVTGNCKVTFGGTATLGVPRTITQINNHPVTCFLFGAGKGDQRILFNQKTNIQDATVTVDGGWIYGSVFGGGEDGHILGDVTMTIKEGAKIGTWGISYVDGNIFGGGRGFAGDALTAGVVCGNVQIDIEGGEILGSIYGGGRLGSVGTYLVPSDSPKYGKLIPNDANQVIGGEDVSAPGATHGNIEINISGGTIGNNFEYVYPTNEQIDPVSGDLRFAKYDPTTKQLIHSKGGNVFTGSMGRREKLDGTVITGWEELGKCRNTTLTITGGTIKSNVYGGSEFGRVEGIASVSISQDVGKTTTIGTRIPKSGDNPEYYFGSVYGGGMGNATYGGGNIGDGTTVSSTNVSMSGGTVRGNVYGGCETAHVKGSTTVELSGSATIGVSSSTDTSIGNLFGGGQAGDVEGSVDVTITGGNVINDVYGGGALASTNTAGWDGSAISNDYYEVTGLTPDQSIVTGYYTKSGQVYTEITTPNAKAESETTYYQYRSVYTTTVTLTGGTVGNVYGGGLGAHATATVAAIEPKVYGDIAVTVNKKDGTGTARFTRAYETHEYLGHYKDANNVEQTKPVDGIVYTKGNVFGANNKEGTPKGNIQVTVWSTTPDEGKTHTYGIYEIQNVYGGGNLSAYNPVEGKATHVDIHGCDRTSIQFVFGGGNAAFVPVTNVTIWGTFEIETVFGGGNGSQPIWSQAQNKWIESPGAAVTTSNVWLKGGYMHSAFGGSYERGTVTNTNVDNTGTGGECRLRVTDIFGGGKDADVDNIDITISDCDGYGKYTGTGTDAGIMEVKNVYAGSYNARIFGNVKMNVMSGIFTNVFGGNHTSGFIKGTITINIEENENCKPVIIDNLYGGGNYAPYPGPGANNPDPKITVNVKAATRIGNIFGGCNHADVNGDTEVNINMIKGWWAGRTYTNEDGTIAIDDAIGKIGNVYGGGNEGNVIGKSVVNIGTEKEVTLDSIPDQDPITKEIPLHMRPKANGKYDVLGANITGDVFGGCKIAHVMRRKNAEDDTYVPGTGNTWVNICTEDYSNTSGFEGVSIGASVYGGGCDGNVEGNTYVTMDGGYVFDGVYGGGLHGNVGSFEKSTSVEGHTPHANCIGKPVSCTAGTGKCTVVVSGGRVGPLEVSATNGGMKNTGHLLGITDGPVDVGFVFGAGRGAVENPNKTEDVDFHTYVNETEVIIKNQYEAGHAGTPDSLSHIAVSPLIMASVYGGGENGRVLGNTMVKIWGGQIGCGEGKTEAYSESDFIDPLTSTATQIDDKAATMTECASWDYTSPYLPHDPYAKTGDIDDAKIGTDGHTYYGNVFGGGSGYFPYYNEDNDTHEWLRSAGWVEGNSTVLITGGHILTNVYGGNETTDVGGKCTVEMSGGTLGVPRTLGQIAAHPVTCYLFGGGKGDTRTHFNKWTNVGSVEVKVSGGIIYGSVFGGGEDGHVLGDVTMEIMPGAKIGTWGTSYVDGNVFGGGRGFTGEAYTAGNVAGNVTVNITGGTMLGSVYGGGRLGSVGYDLKDPSEEGYGVMSAVENRGHIDVTIDGRTNPVIIGNKYEYRHFTLTELPTTGKADLMAQHIPNTGIVYDADRGYYMLEHTKGGNVFAGGMGRREKLGSETDPIDFPGIDWQKLGCVKSTKVTVKGNKVWIKGSVYGGGEYGNVAGTHVTEGSKTVGTEVIMESGTIGTVIGAGNDGNSASLDFTMADETGSGDVRYSFGSIFGGGYGTDADIKTTDDKYSTDVNKFGALVTSNTDIKMTGGTVHASVYGGGKIACVSGNTNVDISGGTVGVGEVRVTEGPKKGYVLFGSSRMGNVFGGGRGVESAVTAGLVQGNATVNISEPNSSNPTRIYHNVYGGGAISSVGTYELYYPASTIPEYLREFAPVGSPKACTSGGTATVTITGGQIGINGWDNGMVYGSGRGDVTKPVEEGGHAFDPYDRLAWVNNTIVTIGQESDDHGETLRIQGSVYGGGENGHNFNNSTVDVWSGTIGISAAASNDNGNVYGAGCGTDKYWDDEDNDGVTDEGEEHHNRTAGFVQGNATVNIRGAHIINNVYGGGSMASVGIDAHKANVNILSGTIDGSVFGGPKGDLTDKERKARAKATELNIKGGTIAGDAFGGGFAGIVEGNVVVNMTGGTVGDNLYGGGSLADTNVNNLESYDETSDNEGKTITSTKTNTTKVFLLGGTITGDAYGGGRGQFARAASGTPGDPVSALELEEPKVYGDIAVYLNGVEAADYVAANHSSSVSKMDDPDLDYRVPTSNKGCTVTQVFGSNDLRGTPKGHVKVHVFATQHKNKATIAKTDKYARYAKLTAYSITDYDGLVELAGTVGADVSAYVTILTGSGTEDAKKAALQSMRDAVRLKEVESIATALGVNISGYSTLAEKMEAVSKVKYDVLAVYGGGDLAPYIPHNAAHENTEVIIDGCDLTSIKQVYGSGNAASAPATYVRVNGTYEIDECFGGGNGHDNYTLYGKWYENPGADIGYKGLTHHDTSGSHGTGEDEAHKYEAIYNANADTKVGRQNPANGYMYGTGEAKTEIYGGRIHKVYGGSNEKGNIREVALSEYQDAGSCEFLIDESYGGGKNALIDGRISVTMDCVDVVDDYYGGNTNADANSDIVLNINNGTFNRIFGGNNLGGRVNGSITINIKENGCRPIFIKELYGCGNEADYSIYGYYTEEDVIKARTKEQYDAMTDEQKAAEGLVNPYKDPIINIISASRIGSIYGAGHKALVIGNPHVNVNMEEGKVVTRYANNANGTIKEEYSVAKHTDAQGNEYEVVKHEANRDAILAIGKIGEIYGGGNLADVYGNTKVDIGTGKWINENYETEEIDRNAAFITGNVYGGGKMGHVGLFTLNGSGKPVSCYEGTGICTVTISNGEIGPNNMKMHNTVTGKPDDSGHVFGAGQGTNLPADANKAFSDSTEVIINGTAWVKGSVFGGGENGHVLHNAGVKIGGNCQIGNGHLLIKENGSTIIDRGVNRRYTDDEWANGALNMTDADFTAAELAEGLKAKVNTRFAASLPECDSWPYEDPWAPYDKFAGEGGYDAQGGSVVASSGRAFNGSVFGGGSGFFPYEPGKWLSTAGQVEGDTWVEVSGGHILTSLYGGCEMSSMLGDTHVKMKGGTVGVPRTLDEIAAHPVTCYVFGGGKGEERSFFNENTDVRNTLVEIQGGWVYGSVFGGAEDGHVLGNAKVEISESDSSPENPTYADYFAGRATKIGTWGTSYVDGNIFGGGRGYDGKNTLSGRIGGNVTVNVSGGKMLGSVYGGGRLGSVGIDGVVDGDGRASLLDGDDHGVITVNITGGTIGNEEEFQYVDDTNYGTLHTGVLRLTEFEDAVLFKNKIKEEAHPDDDAMGLITEADVRTPIYRLSHTKGGNVFAGCMGRLYELDGSTVNSNWGRLALAKKTVLNISQAKSEVPTIIKGNVYGGGEFGAVGNPAETGTVTSTTVNISGGTIGTPIMKNSGNGDVPQYYFGSVYAGGYGSLDEVGPGITDPKDRAGLVKGNTVIDMTAGTVLGSIYGGGEVAPTDGTANITISGGAVGVNKVRKGDGYVMYGSSLMGNVFGAGKGRNSYTLAGVVKGNTNITINPGTVEGEPFIYHNVYGGGALGSVGTFTFSDGETGFMASIPKGIPLEWTENTGIATVNIKGGTIGISGRDNGMVNGSSRGDIAKPEPTVLASAPGGTDLKDPYDKMAWVKQSVVNIGENATAGPHIKGSVYGGGENGHVFTHATVNVKSGTIGIVDEADPWFDFEDDEINAIAWVTRGNVYGAGCGTDTYTGDDKKEHHNTWAGCVIGNTDVNISGGHVAQCVYGGGSLGSVGRVLEGKDKEGKDNMVIHDNATNGFALSWPVEFKYDNLSVQDPVEMTDSTGKTTVNITGGRIGTTGSDNGDVFGGSRGEAGEDAQLANVRKTEVNINYSTPADATGLSIIENYDKEDKKNKYSLRVEDGVDAICGSVYGGAENGHVNMDTKVTLTSGLIGHSVYGGGKGKGEYTRLKYGATPQPKENPSDPDVYLDTDYESVYSLTAGKVYGNTEVIMEGGHVVRNIYGGGNLGSVGKGNYAGGTDDFYSDGYGEKITENLWTSASGYDPALPIDGSNKPSTWADHFLGSGIATVNIKAGTVGFKALPTTPVKPMVGSETTFGAVTEGSDADLKANVVKVMSKDGLPTGNVFGGCRGQAASEDMNILTNPNFFLGYVNQTAVTIGQEAKSAVGTEGDDDYEPAVSASSPRIYGSVYGGGQDGHVRRGTNVTVKKGEIGIKYTPANVTLFGDLTNSEGKDNLHWLHRGNVFGGGSGIGTYEDGTGEHPSSSAGSVTHTTNVNVTGGINGVAGTEAEPGNVIYRNIYGGGSVASVTPPLIDKNNFPNANDSQGKGKMCCNTVEVSGTVGVVDGYVEKYGGEVYGASRGDTSLNPNWFAISVWTKVLIRNGARIMNNVFGGGDSGIVLKDTDVQIGD